MTTHPTKKILLIEDNPDVRENTAEILELAGYKVFTAPNGKVGVALAQEHKPDLIICDIMMPELDGYGVLWMLNKNPETAQIPFIFLSARVEKSDIRKGMNMGADDYITKPFEDTDLLGAVETRLRKNAIAVQEVPKTNSSWHTFIDTARKLNTLPQLSEKSSTRTCKAKEVVFVEGSMPASLYFVQKGTLKTYRTNADGKEYITGVYKVGDYFGYMDLLRNSPYEETAAAIEECELIIIPREDFYTLVYDNREVAYAFMRLLADNLSEKHDRLMHLAYDTIRKRVADALLFLQTRYEGGESMAVSRENLANIVGTSKECVIRVLSEFREDGIIETDLSKIAIVNKPKLERIRF